MEEEVRQDIQKNIANDGVRFFIAWLISRFLLAPFFWIYTRLFNSTEIIGKEHLEEVKGKPFLLCPNHTCSFDIWAGWEVGFLAVRSFFSMDTYLCGLGAVERLGSKPIRTFCLGAGVLPVDRTKGIEQYALQDLVRLFQDGKKIIGAMIYPEGTRSLTGRLSRNFKSGVGWVQAQTGVPVVPMYHIGYTDLPGFRKKLKIVIGKPIYFDELQEKKDNPVTWITISKKVMEEIRKLENEYNPAQLGQDLEAEGTIDYRPHSWLPHLQDLSRPLVFAKEGKKVGLVPGARELRSLMYAERSSICAMLPPQNLSDLGNKNFQEVHGVKYSYCVAPFEREVCSPKLVAELAQQGILGFCPVEYMDTHQVNETLTKLRSLSNGKPYGVGYKYHPHHPDLEEHMLELFVSADVPRLFLSHYVQATKAMVHYRLTGLTANDKGVPQPKHQLFIRVPHTGLAEYFAQPAPQDLIDALVTEGRLTEEEGLLGSKLPLSQDIIVDGDVSRTGGKQDIVSLFPALRHSLRRAKIGRSVEVRVGVAGELATPEAINAAFKMGADFVVTGSVNGLTIEAGGSQARKELLAKAKPEDFVSAPSFEYLDADYRVRVTKFGTMFATKANRMEELYRATDSLDGLTHEGLKFLEQKVFQCSLVEAYDKAEPFLRQWWPNLVEQATTSPKVRASLLLKWFLFESNQWAIDGVQGRQMDYQVRGDGAVGSFNLWRENTEFNDISKISVVQLALNLLKGAAVISRMQVLKEHGVPVPKEAIFWKPQNITSSE